MKKRALCFLICLFLPLISASSLEISDTQFAMWEEELRWLVEEIGERRIGEAGEKEALEYLRSKFLSFGFSYENGTLDDFDAEVPRDNVYDATSLIAYLPAESENPAILTVCAHYDSRSPGARDNASGVAAMLVLADLFSQRGPYPDTELRFIAFSAEETGSQGSKLYCEMLLDDEIERSIAVFNVDIFTIDIGSEHAFSIDTLGKRTENGYISGSAENPAYNRAALSTLAAMKELGYYTMEDLSTKWNLPRHWGESDHASFHEVGIDAANICFHHSSAENGGWPEILHTNDVMGDFDLERTHHALNILYTAVDGLAKDHAFGSLIPIQP